MSCLRSPLFPLVVALALTTSPLHAQPTLGTPVDVRIDAQPLAQALQTLARQARFEVMVAPALVAGRTAPAIAGRLTARDALDRLLAGSGLVADMAGTTVTVRRAPEPPARQDGATLPAVNVTARAERDPSTEKTGSYTTDALTLGKMTQSIRETPQSVTVVTRQQMDDQNLVTVEQVLAQSTGMTKSQRNFGAHVYTIRGFEIPDTHFLIDGVSGTIYNPTGWVPMDTAIFDRVETLRGAGGLLVGAGDPSGIVNLVRKRARLEPHFDVAVSAGSWNNYRTEIDTGRPLNDAGTVRGRIVAAYQDRRHAQDWVHSQQPMLYGTVDIDLAPSTTLTVGARHQQNDIDGYTIYGLPRFTNGAALDVSHATSLSQTWNSHEARTDEWFADVEHRFGGDWRARFTANHNRTRVDQKLATMRGGVDPDTLAGTRLNSVYFMNRDVTGDGVDAHVTGSFKAWGGTHQAMLGANASRQKLDARSTTVARNLPIDIHAVDHDLIPLPAQPDWATSQTSTEERRGLYGSTRLQLAAPLHLLLGGRVSWFSFRTVDHVAGSVTNDYEAKAEVTPYAGVTYDLNRQWTAYASYADTFTPQSQYATVTGAALEPAVGANVEAGLKGELDGGRLNVTMAVFHVKKRNVAVADLANAGACPGVTTDDCYVSSRFLKSKGVELEATGRLTPGWDVTAGYTHVTSRDEADMTISAETPKHLLRASTAYRLPSALGPWTIGGGVSAQSGYDYAEGSVQLAEPGRAVWDLRTAYRIDDTWTAALNVDNVFDKRYWSTLGSIRNGNYLGAPRSVMFTLRGAFF